MGLEQKLAKSATVLSLVRLVVSIDAGITIAGDGVSVAVKVIT
jgi:hypothetical protein